MRRTAVLPTSSSSFSHRLLLLLAAFIAVLPAGRAAEDAPVIASLKQKADSGFLDAMNSLGDAFARGEGVTQDYGVALRYYNQAAARGHPAALFNVGQLAEAGHGMSVDRSLAFRSYVKSAEQGWAPAQLKVAEMFAAGVGTARDDSAAVVWYRKAALSGNAEAQYSLGLAYEQGRGVAKDRVQAQKWYRDAADRGNIQARFNLALMLEGGLGSNPDTPAAAQLYRVAAEQGFAPAQNNYGLLLAEGRGTVPANLVEAYAWLTIANENGTSSPARNLVAEKLTPEQLAAANERAAVLRAQLASRAFVVAQAPEVAPPQPAPRPVTVSRAGESPNPVVNAPVSPKTTAEPLVTAAPDAQQLARLEAQLAAATREIAELRAEQDRLYRSSAQLVVDFGELLANAAEAVKARGSLVAAEQRLSNSAATAAAAVSPSERGPAPKTPIDQKGTAAGAEVQRETEALRAAATKAFAKWTEQMARLNSDMEQIRSSKVAATTPGKNETAPANTAASTALVTAEDAALKAEIGLLSKQVHELTANNDTLRREQDRLIKEAVTLTAAAEQAHKNEALAVAAAKRDSGTSSDSPAVVAPVVDDTAAKEAASLAIRVKELTATNGSQKEDLERWKAEAQKLSNDIRSAQDSLAAARRGRPPPAEWASEREQLRAAVRESTQKLADAERKLAKAPQPIAASPSGPSAEELAAKAEVASLTTQVKALTASNGSLKDDLERWKAESQKLSTDIRATQEALTAARRAPPPPSEWAAERERLQADARSSKEKLADAEQRLVLASQAVETAKSAALAGSLSKVDSTELTSRIAALSQANEKLRDDQARLANENAKLVAANQTATEAAQTAQRAPKVPPELLQERDSLRAQLADGSTKLTTSEQALAELKKAADIARDETAAAKAAAQKAQADLQSANQQGARIGELTATVEQLTKERTALQQQVSGIDALRIENSKIGDLAKSLAAAQKRVTDYDTATAQLAVAQRDLASLRSEAGRSNSAAQAQILERRTQVAQLQLENATLMSRLRQAQGTLDQIASAARVVTGGSYGSVTPGSVTAPAAALAGLNPPAEGTRTYTVAEGDSLTRISVRYYGTGNRWQEIYNANRDVLRGQTALRIGQLLRVP